MDGFQRNVNPALRNKFNYPNTPYIESLGLIRSAQDKLQLFLSIT